MVVAEDLKVMGWRLAKVAISAKPSQAKARYAIAALNRRLLVAAGQQ